MVRQSGGNRNTSEVHTFPTNTSPRSSGKRCLSYLPCLHSWNEPRRIPGNRYTLFRLPSPSRVSRRKNSTPSAPSQSPSYRRSSYEPKRPGSLSSASPKRSCPFFLPLNFLSNPANESENQAHRNHHSKELYQHHWVLRSVHSVQRNQVEHLSTSVVSFSLPFYVYIITYPGRESKRKIHHKSKISNPLDFALSIISSATLMILELFGL